MSVNMDRISFIALWDTYRGLLTPTQREITDMYFELDLTVSEIAEQKGVSSRSTKVNCAYAKTSPNTRSRYRLQ